MFPGGMGLMRALGRAGSLALAGAAAGYYLHRKGLLGGTPATLGPPAEPPFAPQPETEPETVDGVVEEAELPADEPAGADGEHVPEDAELVTVEEALEPEPDDVTEPPPAEEERPDVAAVVDDLLAWGRPQEGAMADADVVDESEDARLAEAVRIALAEEPGLLSAPVDIEVQGARVTLRGELERPEGIAAVERKVEAVEGVSELQSLLHLTGTPPPERR
jgi:BON domain